VDPGYLAWNVKRMAALRPKSAMRTSNGKIERKTAEIAYGKSGLPEF
jgi:hypothetical protein